MPQPVMHILLACRLLERWQREPQAAPFRAEPQVLQHFAHGALAPDIGFFPGCSSRISRLVHAGGSARAARRLLATARTNAEVAFAWGWVSHVIADIELHPLVNAAVAAADGNGRPYDRAGFESGHARIELGLDAQCYALEPALRRLRLRTAYGRHSIDHVAHALRFVYNVPLTPRKLLSWHRNVAFFYNAHVQLARLAAHNIGLLCPAGPGLRLRHLRWAGRLLLDRASAAYAFLDPFLPDTTFREAVNAGLRRSEQIIARYAVTDLTHLMDHDLETGQPCVTRPAVRPGRTRLEPALLSA